MNLRSSLRALAFASVCIPLKIQFPSSKVIALLMLGIVLGVSPQSSQAAVVTFTANLAPESAGATGSGFAQVDFDIVAHTMRVLVNFSGLSGNTTVAHIHGPTTVPGTGTAGVMTATPSFAGFPAGVTSGTFDATFDTSLASTYRAGFITANGNTTAGAEAAMYASLLAGTAYLNIHSATFPGGEIRGFLNLQSVPEPASITTLAIGSIGLLLGRRFAKRK
jgi:hypothetical protein